MGSTSPASFLSNRSPSPVSSTPQGQGRGRGRGCGQDRGRQRDKSFDRSPSPIIPTRGHSPNTPPSPASLSNR